MSKELCVQCPEPDLASLATDIVGARQITGLSAERLRELDSTLRPLRFSRGVRIYSVPALERFRAERDARKAGAK